MVLRRDLLPTQAIRPAQTFFLIILACATFAIAGIVVDVYYQPPIRDPPLKDFNCHRCTDMPQVTVVPNCRVLTGDQLMSILTQNSFSGSLCRLIEPLKGDGSGETIRQQVGKSRPKAASEECCLVQIYPSEVVNGMMLLEAERWVVGRDSSADLVLADASISRQHAEFIRDSSGYRLRDLASMNGTLVNEVKIKETLLRSGDTLQIGTYIFKFLSAGSVESKYHETVYSAMTRDALTGAMNKRYLLESLRREIARASRQRETLSVLMLDIDHFKKVNDTFGHLIGDEVLREFGARVLRISRDDDLLARYGGEEFCLVLCSTKRLDALAIAERNRLTVAATPFKTTAGPLSITASFGLSCLNPGDLRSSDELLHLADENLYKAKRWGRNRVVG